ncbi:MAG: hypothetical protein IKL35_01465 [Muribaculaceae bacterium]|nr:hypothetical protein [Muribaculaceae bacterium]
MKKITLFFIGLISVLSIYGQNVLNLSTGHFSSFGNTEPTRIVNQYADSIVVSYDFTSAKIVNDNLFEKTIWWHIDGFSINDIPGEASLPVKLDSYKIPNGYTVSVSVVDSSYVDYNYELTPARQPLVDSANEFYTKDNVIEISLSDGFAPNSVIDATETQIYRGTLIQKIRIYPIQYDSKNKKVRAYTHIKYKIAYESNPAITALSKNKNVNTFDTKESKSLDSLNCNRQDYLIVTTNKYLEVASRFAEWKKLLGFNVHISANDSWTSSSIKTTVANIYQEFPNLYYLLIIGDHEDVPGQFSGHYFTHYTDLYYGCFDGREDYTPEIYRGRISVSTIEEANIVIDKIINYEQNPPLNPSFYNTGLNCSYFQDTNGDGYADRRFAQTSEDIRSYLISKGKIVERIYSTGENINPLYWNNGTYSNGESIPSELRKPTFAWDGNSSDIINSINNGRFYVLHRDHGSEIAWGDPYFDKSHINQLSNGELLPIVFSISCSTGEFKYSSEPCFAETFLRKQNGGCVAIFGATEISFSGYNEALILGMFDAIWNNPGLRVQISPNYPMGESTPTPTYRLGQILDQGFNRMKEIYASAGSFWNKYHSEIFHCFGDPSMRIYTSQPTEFSNVTINRVIGNVSVNLNGATADITFYDHRTGEVLCYRGSSASYPTRLPQFVSVCISDHNKIPYISYGNIPSHIYIQNETISTDKNYDAGLITIGTNVTDTKPTGDVIIQCGEITMSASEYVIHPNVSILSGAKVTLNIK